MARARTTKAVAQRIDLNYFKRATPFKRARLWLAIGAPVAALVWLGHFFFVGDHRVYSSGGLSEAHAVLEKQCAACHVQQAGGFSAKAADSACLACHDGPAHHKFDKEMDCSDCHVEHRGRRELASVSSESCAFCHARLSRPNWGHIENFEKSHPEFSALRPADGRAARDSGTIKLNHALHMKAIRRGPNGPTVQLECGDCHRPAVSKDAQWEYGDAKYVAAPVSYQTGEEVLPIRSQGLTAPRPETGRELMAPVKFANACAGCHLLTFDRRFDEGVPHDEPKVVHAYLVKQFSTYVAAHPNELREVQDPQRKLAGRETGAAARSLSPAQWVSEQVAVSEELLWHKTCSQCHDISPTALADVSIARWDAANSRAASAMAAGGSGGMVAQALPMVAPANTTLQWLPHARFDHDAHQGFSCQGCHSNATKSAERSDILIPGIAVCQTCHAPGPGHAESRCSECHTYHDWEQRKEVRPRFTLPALRGGGN